MFSFRACLAAALAAALSSCGGAAEAPATAQEGPVVEVVTVASAGEAGIVRASGLVAYKRETELSFNAPGVIARIDVDEGDTVRAGQRLATLRRTTAGTNADETALARITAERQLERTQALFDRGFVSQAALDDARLAASRASDSAVITAPAAGVILRRRAEPAQGVQAAQPVLLLGEINSGIVVRVSVSSRDAARIRIGDSVSATIAGEVRSGAVARIAAKSDDATGAFEVEVMLNDAAGIRSGQVADVEISAAAPANAQGALIVPTLSLLDARADQAVVFVVDAENVARRRAVETAGLYGDSVLIVSGLAPGERIVAAGAAYVRDGEPVRFADPPALRN